MRTVFVFAPSKLHQHKNIGFMKGFSTSNDGVSKFYITSTEVVNSSSGAIGYCSDTTPSHNIFLTNSKNLPEWLHLNSKTGEITVFDNTNKELFPEKDVISILYDHNAFRQLDFVALLNNEYGEYFDTLIHNIVPIAFKESKESYAPCIEQSRLQLESKLFKYSSTFHYLLQWIMTCQWLFKSFFKTEKVPIKAYNIFFAKVVDTMLGWIVFYYCLKYESVIFKFCQDSTTSVIEGLAQVLSILMGSPAGLKLNYSFNKILGVFFFYHLALWQSFVHVMNPLLHSIFYLLIWPGILLGLNYHVAIISDLIAFFTFQVYCIYVYAASLYRVQINGIMSLFKLFIGRKYNPLRKRVDSIQYTRHQLFIGTLGFTVLLFLLPTTFLYYAVFSSFRIILQLAEAVLCQIQTSLQNLPIYIFILWLLKSPKIHGVIHLERVEDKFLKHTTLRASLRTLQLRLAIGDSLTLFNNRPKVNITRLVNNILSGKLD